MRTLLQLKSSLSEEATKALLGKKGRPEDAPLIVRGDASVYKPGGQRLLTVVRGAIDGRLIADAYPFMWDLRKQLSFNRGSYSGTERDTGNAINVGVRYRPIKRDGTISNTVYARPVASSLVGYFDRNARFPYCRETAYTSAHPEAWKPVLPFLRRVAELFAETVPDRYAAQLEVAQRTHPAYLIAGTPFTTVTVNNTVSGAYHTDKGDYAPGFGVMVVFRRGEYRGCELIFPRYGIGADLQHGDVIFFDPHEVHGNTPFFGGHGREGDDWARISMVLYYRQHMVDCLEPAQELERAKRVRGAV